MVTVPDHRRGYLVHAEHPDTAEVLARRAVSITAAVATAAELISAGYAVHIMSAPNDDLSPPAASSAGVQ